MMTNLMRKLMLNCEQATFLIAKEMSVTLTFTERIKMRFHLMACKYCSLFKKQSRFINLNVEHLHQPTSEVFLEDLLDDTTKQAMEQALHTELNKDTDEN